MKKFFKKHLKNEKGLTLIELLAVIVILAIIAAIAVPAIGNIIDNSRDSAKLAAASNILAGAKIAATDGACTTDESAGTINCSKTELDGYVENVSGGSDVSYSASRNDKNEWSVTYGELKNFKSKKYSGESISTTISETKLNELLSK